MHPGSVDADWQDQFDASEAERERRIRDAERAVCDTALAKLAAVEALGCVEGPWDWAACDKAEEEHDKAVRALREVRK